MARLNILETIRTLQAISEVIEYYEKQQKGLGVRFLRAYDCQLELLRDMPHIGRTGRVFGTRELIIKISHFL